jgi:hypothetical protein
VIGRDTLRLASYDCLAYVNQRGGATVHKKLVVAHRIHHDPRVELFDPDLH